MDIKIRKHLKSKSLKKMVLVTGGNGQLAQCINDIRSTYPNIDFVFTDVDELDITNQISLHQEA